MNNSETFEQHGDFMSIKRAANVLKIPETSLRRLLAQGHLPGFYSGRKFVVNTAMLRKWIEDESSPINSQGRG